MALAAAALAVSSGGCGFHPVGSTGELPEAMRTTYVASGEPYGYLETRLRRAMLARGVQVTKSRREASAVLMLLQAGLKRRVLAVNTRGQPKEYGLEYRVRFGLLGAHGETLLAPQSIELQRYLAYNPAIELGTSRRQVQLKRDMQNEAVQRIMLRLEALNKQEKKAKTPR